MWTGVKVVVLTAALVWLTSCARCGPWLTADNEEATLGVQCERELP